VTILAAATGSHVFWVTSRAAGLVALILASASVGVGVSMGGRMIRGRGPDLKVIHEALSIATLAAVALHALALLGDAYFHPTIADLTIPFASGYREPYMALGIIAGWCLFAFGLSFYARKQIGIARWKVIHRFTALAWMLGVIHTLGEGSDAGRIWFLAIIAVVVAPTLVLVLARVARRRPRRNRAAGAVAGRTALS
jgi:sulfoxide reductase heme-binding subunit YedZ